MKKEYLFFLIGAAGVYVYLHAKKPTATSIWGEIKSYIGIK